MQKGDFDSMPFVLFVIVAGMLVGGAWCAFEAPCSWYAGTPVPARCLPELAHPGGGK